MEGLVALGCGLGGGSAVLGAAGGVGAFQLSGGIPSSGKKWSVWGVHGAIRPGDCPGTNQSSIPSAPAGVSGELGSNGIRSPACAGHEKRPPFGSLGFLGSCLRKTVGAANGGTRGA